MSETSHVEAPVPEESTAAPDGGGDGDGDGGGGGGEAGDGSAEARAQRAESAKFQDQMENELESDLGKNAASLAGAINMDGGEMGSIGGIPDGEDDSDPWGDHEISDLHHAVAFGVALVMCLIFSAWVASAFFEIKRDAGWANLPRVVLTDNARKLINSVDKEFKA